MKRTKLIATISIGVVGAGLIASVPFTTTSCSFGNDATDRKFTDLKVGDDLTGKYLIFNRDTSWNFSTLVSYKYIIKFVSNATLKFTGFVSAAKYDDPVDSFSYIDSQGNPTDFCGHFSQDDISLFQWKISDDYFQFTEADSKVSLVSWGTGEPNFDTWLNTLRIVDNI